MRANITDATCDFGLARTAAGCVRTLASLDSEAYVQTQLLYLVLGFLLSVVMGFLYWRASRNDCAKLQQRSLLLCFFAALTFVVRGADPGGYKRVLPRPVSSMLANSCTAAIFTIYIMSLVYWASIIQQGVAQLERPLKTQRLQYASISAVWAFYLLLSASSFMSKGFLTPEVTLAQMVGGVILVLLVSAAFLVYGLRVMSRLRVFERQQLQQRRLRGMRTQAFMDVESGTTPVDVDSVRGDKTAFLDADAYNSDSPAVLSTKSSHATRIRTILLTVESLALFVVVAQVYVGVTRFSKPAVELDCANGLNCDLVHCSIHLLHWVQAACIAVVAWVFRNTQKKECHVPDQVPRTI